MVETTWSRRLPRRWTVTKLPQRWTEDGGIALPESLLNAPRQPPIHGNNGGKLLNKEEEEEPLPATSS